MNKIEIKIPVDKEVDWVESQKQNKIILKDAQQLTYEQIRSELLKNDFYFINSSGYIDHGNCSHTDNCAKTIHQLTSLLDRNKLINTAIYLNDRWKPNLHTDYGYVLQINHDNAIIITQMAVKCPYSTGRVIFKSEELARQAVEILGKETVKSALSTFY